MGFFGSLDWSNWLYGLWVAIISGGSTAVQGALLAGMIVPNELGMGTAKSFKLIAGMFAWSACKDFFLYLKQNPAPKIRTVTTVETVTQKQFPPAVVTTTVEKTQMTDAPPSPDGGGVGTL